MVDLMYRTFTFCQFFLSSETRKLIASFMLSTSCCSVIAQWPIATFKHNTFLSWNLIIAFISSTLLERSSDGSTTVGNLPALFKPGPSRRGICLISDSEARKTWYFLAATQIAWGSSLRVSFCAPADRAGRG